MTRYRMILRALPGDSRPPEIRLRRLLKIALRAFRLRCDRVELVPRPVVNQPIQPANTNGGK